MISAGSNKVMECYGVKRGENVLIVVDTLTPSSIGKSLFEAAKNLGCEVMVMTMLPRSRHGEEIPVPVAEAMKNSDVVIRPYDLFTYSYTSKDKCLQSRSKGRFNARHYREYDGNWRDDCGL